MKRYRWLAVLMVLGLVAAACSRDDETTTNEGGGSATTSAASNPACEGVTLEATDTGVTADTITIQVMADTGSPLAPGLFQGNVDAVEAFASFVNENGGVGCRDLEVETWDSKLTPDEAKNGQIQACTNALAMVGGNSLFNPDVTEMNTCADAQGQPTGIPNISALANDINEQCAANSFIIQGIAETCNPDGTPPTGTRPLIAMVGPTKYYLTLQPELTGLFMVPGDLPTTVQSATYQISAQAEVGVDWIGAFKVSGRAEQSAYTPLVQNASAGNANYIYNGSNDVAMINMRREAAAQNLTGIDIWACSLACYTQKFKDAGADVDGTYGWMQFLPFEDKGSNQELDNYLDSIGTPDSFGAQAWMAAVAFQQAVDEIVTTEGPNAITRAKLLEVLNGFGDFDANGWMGPKSLKGGFSDCQVIVQLEAGEWVRQLPTEKGELDCNPDYLITQTLDPAVEAEKVQ
ncbi:MAG: ABC transporter substrate-binding protein [Acidimicrobiales bacterium]|jgi:ABC-type branched-subunit amino acid transport system substrate-binding protein|nr:ABC transporter substrate-binding protein [Acidimicrobiales bacterium]